MGNKFNIYNLIMRADLYVKQLSFNRQGWVCKSSSDDGHWNCGTGLPSTANHKLLEMFLIFMLIKYEYRIIFIL